MIHITPREVAEIIGAPFENTAHSCHAVSLAVVKAKAQTDPAWAGARVARGTCEGVIGQHSWIVIGADVYQPGLPLVDPTLWSYNKAVAGVYHGVTDNGWHVPHGGAGDIWEWGRPAYPKQAPIPLTPKGELSSDAQLFLELLGPLDRRGWMTLADAPVAGWPAREIIAAMYDTPEIRALIPIDRVGMLTDYNPAGLYLPGGDPEGDE